MTEQIASAISKFTPVIEHHTTQITDIKTQITGLEIQITALKEQEPSHGDQDQKLLQLAALEESLIVNPIYANALVVSNWGALLQPAREKMINDAMKKLNKKALRIEHVGKISKVHFEAKETAIALKAEWIKNNMKNDVGQPIFIARDIPKVVRDLRRGLTTCEQLLKKAVWASGDHSKKAWRVNWAAGGVLTVDKTVVVKRNAQCKLEWEDQGKKALYDTAVSAKQAADAPMAQAVA
jgi:hypothetical protein